MHDFTGRRFPVFGRADIRYMDETRPRNLDSPKYLWTRRQIFTAMGMTPQGVLMGDNTHIDHSR